MNWAEELKAMGNVHVDPNTPAPERTRYGVIANLAVAHLPPGGSVLDLGSGAGEILKLIQTARPDVRLSAADAFQECLDAAQRQMPLAAQYLISERNFDLSVITDRFDVVVFSHTLEHLWHPTKGMLDLVGLLKPGGIAIVAVPNLARPDALLKALLRRHYVNRGHVVGWDHSHFKNFLEEILKLNVISYQSDGISIFPRRLTHRLPFLSKIEMAAARLAPYWSFSNIALVKAAE
jgi:2-polyprenyl-3-methyl-5-hydroxy-6-metoxy-1,4-benzoquinol methylase